MSLRQSLLLATALAAVAASPASAQTVEPMTTTAPDASPLDLGGSSYALGARVARGDSLPRGASVVHAAITFAAAQPEAQATVDLACPAGTRVVEGVFAAGLTRELRLGVFHFDPDRSTSTGGTVSAQANLPAERRVRVGVACFDERRLTTLRSSQERSAVRRVARTRPEVRRAPRRAICRSSYVQKRPGALFIGSVGDGDAVRVLRRSGSGRYTEVLTLNASQHIGWIRTSAICRG